MASDARDENRHGLSVPATIKENGSFPHHMFGNGMLFFCVKVGKD
jgi:hypothetical protein